MADSKALQSMNQGKEIVAIEDYAMSVDKVVAQITLIQHIMKQTMKEDEHYGVIPGTDKPTLLKPGAEKLCLTFRFDPQYERVAEITREDFLAYTYRCSLRHIPTGLSVASGIGSCNSRETKYRYRSQSTGKPVPREYWKHRDSELLGGSQYSPRKKNGQWIIFEQIENKNPWDLDNTIQKMACKRALVAAVLNATAASDIFTQDIEDMPAEMINAGKEEASKSEPTALDNLQAEIKAVWKKLRQVSGKTEAELKEDCKALGLDSLKSRSEEGASKILEVIQAMLERFAQ